MLASLATILGDLFNITSCAPTLQLNSGMALHTRTNLLMHLTWSTHDPALLALRRQLTAAVCHSMADAIVYRDTTYLDFSFLWRESLQSYLSGFLASGFIVVRTECPQGAAAALAAGAARMSGPGRQQHGDGGDVVVTMRRRSVPSVAASGHGDRRPSPVTWAMESRGHSTASLWLRAVTAPGRDNAVPTPSASRSGSGRNSAAVKSAAELTFVSDVTTPTEAMVMAPNLKVQTGGLRVSCRVFVNMFAV